jgi:hypothetical protein
MGYHDEHLRDLRQAKLIADEKVSPKARIAELEEDIRKFEMAARHLRGEIRKLQEACPHPYEELAFSAAWMHEVHYEIWERRCTCGDCGHSWFEQSERGHRGHEWPSVEGERG